MRGRDRHREREREGRWRDNELRRRTDSKCGNDIDEWRHNEDIEGGRRGTETGAGVDAVDNIISTGEWQIVLKDINGI